MKANVAFGPVGVALTVIVSATLEADKTRSEEAFDRLASLQGKLGKNIFHFMRVRPGTS